MKLNHKPDRAVAVASMINDETLNAVWEARDGAA